MTRLSPGDFHAFLRALPELYASRNTQAFLEQSLPVCRALVRCDYSAWTGFAVTGRARLIILVEPETRMTPRLLPLFEQALESHPFASHWAGPEPRTSLMDSDVPERAWLTHMSTFDALYRTMDFARNLTIPIDFGPDTVGGFSFVNKKRPFTERDRLLSNLLQPHLEQAYKNACLFTHASNSNAEVRSRPGFDFTVMESRVAFWLAAGKTNWEIGVILG